MTNGVVLVLGPTGINVGSGMTGGVAYLYDPSVSDDMIAGRLKLSNVKPRRVQNGSPAADTIQRLLREHHEATASKHAKHLLENFDASPSARWAPPSEEDKPHHAVVSDSVKPRWRSSRWTSAITATYYKKCSTAIQWPGRPPPARARGFSRRAPRARRSARSAHLGT